MVARGGSSRLVRLDFDHPVLSTFAEGANGDIGLAAFRRFLEFRVVRPEAGSGSALAYFSGTSPAAPALLSARRGRGRVLLFGSGAARSWGTFYREPSFVPFVHEAVSHLARAEPAMRSYLAGQRASVSLSPAERGGRASLVDRSSSPPDTRSLDVDPESLTVQLGRLRRRGVLELVTESGGRRRTRALAVEFDPGEFDHRRVRPERFLGTGATGAETPGDLRASIGRSRGGIEVSGEVLWATLIVLIAEMLLSARLTRRRSNAAGAGPNHEGAI